MKFEIKDLILGGYKTIDKTTPHILIYIGDIILYKDGYESGSNCYQHDNYFDYHGIEKALCGKHPDDTGEIMFFTPKRILVIQMI